MRRSRPGGRRLAAAAAGLALLFVVRHDAWLWDGPHPVELAGVPFPGGFLYHVLYCVAAALFFAFLLRGGALEALAGVGADGGAESVSPEARSGAWKRPGRRGRIG